MFPQAALYDPIFREYVAIVAVLLLVAGVVLGVLHFVFRLELGTVWKTWRSWLGMAPLAALAILSGRIVFIVGLTLVGLFAFREFARAARVTDRWMLGAVYAALGATGVAALAQIDSRVFLIFALALVALISIWRSARPVSSATLAFVFFGWMFEQLGFLANSPRALGYLCYLLLATELNDVAAFVFGKAFGKHLLARQISPRKTWEGSLGALAFSLLLPWGLRFSFPFFGAWELILTGLIVGLGGQLGDLTFSALKRDFGVKDWGAAIPGHGGVLDRIDSLIFVAPLFMLLVGYYHPDG